LPAEAKKRKVSRVLGPNRKRKKKAKKSRTNRETIKTGGYNNYHSLGHTFSYVFNELAFTTQPSIECECITTCSLFAPPFNEAGLSA
jgi:hypothetical protein